MDYLELHVFRPAAEGEQPQRGVATVLSEGRDLFHSLERSVAELRKSGWAVDDVRAFQTNFRSERAAGRERLKAMLHRARAEGIDCVVDPVPASRQLAVTTPLPEVAEMA
jgi:hypothetical protein